VQVSSTPSADSRNSLESRLDTNSANTLPVAAIAGVALAAITVVSIAAVLVCLIRRRPASPVSASAPVLRVNPVYDPAAKSPHVNLMRERSTMSAAMHSDAVAVSVPTSTFANYQTDDVKSGDSSGRSASSPTATRRNGSQQSAVAAGVIITAV
jgi:hypothetical protein